MSSTQSSSEQNKAFKEPDKASASSIETPVPKKVALKPGRSLLDWIRLSHSGKDLSSTQGKVREVSIEELSRHNRRDDAWICLKGKVYNITHYFEYHPGGEEQLMRGAGRDGTDLFNKIHRWVNAESMLKMCYVGPLKSPSLWLHSDDASEKNVLQDSKSKDV